jgi:hypothetical protein
MAWECTATKSRHRLNRTAEEEIAQPFYRGQARLKTLGSENQQPYETK